MRPAFAKASASANATADKPAGKVDAIVIGAGCAGLSAATALADAGARVLVLEARPGLGGRATAFRDPETGERVDNGQHILMGCYEDTLAFLARIGASGRVQWQTGLSLSMIDRRGHETVLKLPLVASPLHLLGGVMAWDALSWGERLSVLRVGSALGPANRLRQCICAIGEQTQHAPTKRGAFLFTKYQMAACRAA